MEKRQLKMPEAFDLARPQLEKQYADAVYVNGWSRDELSAAFERHCAENPAEPSGATANSRVYFRSKSAMYS